MKEPTFDINSNEEIWELFDKELDHILIQKFMPNEAIKWSQIDLKIQNGKEFKKLLVGQMIMDVQTDLDGLKHFFFVDFEFITIGSFEPEFIHRIEMSTKFGKRIEKRK